MGSSIRRVQSSAGRLGGGTAAAGQGEVVGGQVGGAVPQDTALGGDTRAQRSGRIRASGGGFIAPL